MMLINLLRKLYGFSADPQQSISHDVSIASAEAPEPVYTPPEVAANESLLLFILGSVFYVLLSLVLWLLSTVNKPYLSIVSSVIFCFVQLVMVIWFVLCDNVLISIVAQCFLAFLFVMCFLERSYLAFRLRSLAPFVHSCSAFVVINTTSNRYVFPLQGVAEHVVILTTSAGVSCNGVFQQGAIAVTDTATIYTRFSSYVLLLDRVEHGYDYTVFAFVSTVVLENTRRVGVSTVMTDVEL
uniref:ORF3a protein n=1 Tax=Eidolon bat coronavirus TaxID=2717680 RepID=A0AB38ZDQ1_9NIDO